MSPSLLLCFGFLAVALASPSDPYATRPTCGMTGRTCVSQEASCNAQGQCSCLPGYTYGDADFQCYPDNVMACEIKNDPTVITYNRDSTQFPYPCRYLASHVKTELLNRRGEKLGYCEAMIYAMNGKARGKIFVAAFDVALKITYADGRPEVKGTIRKLITASENYNRVKTSGQVGAFNPFEPEGGDILNYRDDRNGIRIVLDWDENDNQYTFMASGCGIKSSFVPYDDELRRDQNQVPGVSISVDRNHSPEWLSNDEVLCLVPRAKGGQLIQDINFGNLNSERSFLLRTWLQPTPQLSPFGAEASDRCEQVSALFRSCPAARARMAIKNCDWMMKRAKFMKCYDDEISAVNLLKLFQSCVMAWCEGSPCTKSVDKIRMAGCDAVGDVPELAPFLSGAMCPTGGQGM